MNTNKRKQGQKNARGTIGTKVVLNPCFRVCHSVPFPMVNTTGYSDVEEED